MHRGFKELFAECDRSETLLRRLLPAGGPLSPGERSAIAGELLPLLADLGDFADDRDIDERPLCDARLALSERRDGTDDAEVAGTLRKAVARIGQIRTAVHVEGHRRLRAALLGI